MHAAVHKPRRLLPPDPMRVARRAAGALLWPERPFLAQLVVTRRCNLSCGYCNEFDNVSNPVATTDLLRRVDHLAGLGTMSITLTGGEPLLHPELDRVVAKVVSHGMICTAITNAYAITRDWIDRLGRAKLAFLQVSVDNFEPSPMSQKSWSKIRGRLQLLREHAAFGVNVNAVLGSSTIEETRRVVEEVEALGFYMTVGLMHDGNGQIDTGLIGEDLRDIYAEIRARCRKSPLQGIGEGWETAMLAQGRAPFRCRAGARYLYVDEFGLVSYCSQRRGEPGKPLLEYSTEDLHRAFHAPKGCEASCTIGCVRRASALDEWRPQRGPAVAVAQP